VSLGNLSGQTVNLAEPRKPPPLALLAALTALGFCALHMVIRYCRWLARVFDSDPLHVQPVITLYFAGIAVGQLVYGPISDRYGRRPVLLVGLAMFLAGSMLCVVAASLWWLVVGRVLQACGACAGIVLGRAIIRDVHDREGSARALALVMMVMTLAPAISPGNRRLSCRVGGLARDLRPSRHARRPGAGMDLGAVGRDQRGAARRSISAAWRSRISRCCARRRFSLSAYAPR
jgi:MFS family permease